MDSAAIASAMRGLFGLPGIEVESAVAVAEAIGHMEAGLDFADALHRSTTPEERAVYTFDQTFVRRARELGLDVRVVPRMPVEDPPRARGVEPEK
jgi:predicted nucleic acid-binding protein